MKKKIAIIAILLLAIVMSLAFVACNDNEATQYTVTFDAQGGSAVNSVTVDSGAKITEPTAPTKTNFAFGGWYKEAACTNAWAFDTDTVTADTTLYAK